MYAYESLAGAFVSIVRSGPSELLRGFFASALRDAPNAGIFVVFYEGIKREACTNLFYLFLSPQEVLDPISPPSLHLTADFKYAFNRDSQLLGCLCERYGYDGHPPI